MAPVLFVKPFDSINGDDWTIYIPVNLKDVPQEFKVGLQGLHKGICNAQLSVEDVQKAWKQFLYWMSLPVWFSFARQIESDRSKQPSPKNVLLFLQNMELIRDGLHHRGVQTFLRYIGESDRPGYYMAWAAYRLYHNIDDFFKSGNRKPISKMFKKALRDLIESDQPCFFATGR